MTDQPNDSNRKNHEGVLKIVLFVVIAVPVLAVGFVSDLSVSELLPGAKGPAGYRAARLKADAVVLLTLLLPFMAYSHYFFRRHLKTVEIKRILNVLRFADKEYVEKYRDIHSGLYFVLAVSISWVVALVGLSILFLGQEIGIDKFPRLSVGTDQFPQAGSMLVVGFAFLGSYLWGLQHVFRRYVVNDLFPATFYDVAIRMILAATISLLVFNAYAALTGADLGRAGAGVPGAATMWPALAFFIGVFPQRAMRWLEDRIPIFSSRPDPSVRPLLLEMIEGIGPHDTMRLAEVGINTCYDLAVADFIPLMVKTSYGARQLTDWILQAKLCVYCGEAVRELREHGIRTIADLSDLDPEAEGADNKKTKLDEKIRLLVEQTSATKSSLEQARDAANTSEVKRLAAISQKLSRFTLEPDLPDKDGPPG